MTRISFYGAAGVVTGSKYLLEYSGQKVLVDCGLFQGEKKLRELNWSDPPFDPASISAVILTHAHIDHSGYLPRLVKLGFKGPIFTTAPTADLLKILLPDSARLQEEDASYRNRHDLTRHEPALPLYDEQDVRDTLGLLSPVHNNTGSVRITDQVEASFFYAGHILGSSSVLVTLGSSEKLLFSGDLGQFDSPILIDPANPPACDYLICESTYGDRLHGELRPKDQLATIIDRAVERNGPILIPAFAVGRTQEILYTIRELEEEKRIPVVPVILDSPMAAEATKAYSRWTEEQDDEYLSIVGMKRHPLRTASMLAVSRRAESKALNDLKGVRIIISASGMLSGGRVLHHALRVLPDPTATLVLVGFQAAGTRGRLILDGAKSVRIMREEVPVNCHVEVVEGFSAHADWKSILRWLKLVPAPPKTTFLTHGETGSANALAQHIKEELGWNTRVPELGETVEL